MPTAEQMKTTHSNTASSSQCNRRKAAPMACSTVIGPVPAASAFWQAMMAPSNNIEAMPGSRNQVHNGEGLSISQICAGSRIDASAGTLRSTYTLTEPVISEPINAIGRQVRNEARYSLMASSMTPPMGRGAVGLTYILQSPCYASRHWTGKGSRMGRAVTIRIETDGCTATHAVRWQAPARAY